MITKEFSIAGKFVSVYDPGKEYIPDDIKRFLKKFQLNEALRIIGNISHRNIKEAGIQLINGTPVQDGSLAYIALLLIENSNDYRSKEMMAHDLKKALDMYHGLRDPILDDQNAIGCLIRSGMVQFNYQRDMRNLLAKTLIIYRDLWPQNDTAKYVNVHEAIRHLSGLDLEEILVLGFAFCGQSKAGYFRTFDNFQVENPLTASIFTQHKQRSFIDWLSYSYREFRNVLQSENVPSECFEKYRLNPLIKKPIIIPDRNPDPRQSMVYLVPIVRLLFERFTTGLYFDMADFFKGDGKKNSFRSAFGYVLEDYIGIILKNSIHDILVFPQWKYSKPNKLTSDWIVIQGDKGILIEVKQSALYLNAKKWGKEEDINKDISQTFAQAVKQLWRFEKDIKSESYEKLKELYPIVEFERLIISYDHSYFVNSLLRDKTKSLLVDVEPEIPNDYHCHVMSVEDLEYIIDLPVKLFDFLKTKRLKDEYDKMDFNDYAFHVGFGANIRNTYLDKISNDFLKRYSR